MNQFLVISGIILWVFILVVLIIWLFSKEGRLIKVGKRWFLGQRLDNSINKLYDEIAERNIKSDTLADVSKHILWRFTRIGVFAIIAAAIPVVFIAVQVYLLDNQNKLLESQNERIDLQNNLLEADRRSSLVFLMSNILDKVDEEIKEQQDSLKNLPGFHPDSVRYSLSKPLISRIVALSRAFRPYRIMEGDTLSRDLVSPERGQLFIALMENKLDSTTQNIIGSRGDFSYAIIGEINLSNSHFSNANFNNSHFSDVNFSGADLRNANLSNADLRYADFSYANLGNANLSKAILGPNYELFVQYNNIPNPNGPILGANLSKANLKNANLEGAFLIHTNLKEADLFEADLLDSKIISAYFENANLESARLSRAKTNGAIFLNANLSNAYIIEAELIFADLLGANLNEAKLIQSNLREAKNLSVEQLKASETLYQCYYFNSELKAQLRKEKPCLFEDPNGPNACK